GCRVAWRRRRSASGYRTSIPHGACPCTSCGSRRPVRARVRLRKASTSGGIRIERIRNTRSGGHPEKEWANRHFHSAGLVAADHLELGSPRCCLESGTRSACHPGKTERTARGQWNGSTGSDRRLLLAAAIV